MKKLNVGITMGFNENDQKIEIWSNGARQNIIFLYFLLKKIKSLNKVFIVNVGAKKMKDYDLSDLNYPDLKIVEWDDVKDQMDLVIQLGMQLGEDKTKYLQDRKCKIVAYVCGNSYIINLEHMIYKPQTVSSVYIETNKFDEVWTNEQHLNTNQYYLETLYRVPVKTVPHIWNPYFIEKLQNNPKNDKLIFPYQNQCISKRISIFEPNINVVKSFQYPLMICERLYRKYPELINHIMVTNTFHLKDERNFLTFALSLECSKKVATYEKRYVMPEFLAEYTDIVVTHQWENGLNYLYYDALYLKYPLIHNSPFLKNYGYYYEGFNIDDGSEQLKNVIQNHDQNQKEYGKKCEEICWEHHTDNPKNIQIYEDLIKNLFKNGNYPEAPKDIFYSSSFTPDNFKKFFEKIELNFDPEDRILDLGCGNGNNTNHIAKEYDLTIDGVDYSYQRIEIAKDQSIKLGTKGEFFCEEITKYLKKCRKKYDVILMLDSITELKEPWKLIPEIKKMLKPNGFILANIKMKFFLCQSDEIYQLEDDHYLLKWNK